LIHLFLNKLGIRYQLFLYLYLNQSSKLKISKAEKIMTNNSMFNRELSWISFNHRVLQEALDDNVPLFEKIKFMAIFSSNLDEFYRVRVASLRNLLELKEKSRKKLDFDPIALINQVNQYVYELQEILGSTYRNCILTSLRKYNIYIINEKSFNEAQKTFAEEFFKTRLLPYLQPVILIKEKVLPFLQNHSLYFAVKLTSSKQKKKDSKRDTDNFEYGVLNIPSRQVDRFVLLPPNKDKKCITFIDDIIRLFLPVLFPGNKIDSAYAIKLSRDAELYIDDEFSGDLLDKIKKGLAKRNAGMPSRFLFDQDMPEDMLKFLRHTLSLTKEDLVIGGRYHNFSDFFNLPRLGPNDLENKDLPPLRMHKIDQAKSIFSVINKQDFLVHYPYHTYDYVIQMLEEAAVDPKVSSISITLYRVASNSKVVEQLIKAAETGKKVIAFVELKARFDEESNIISAGKMEQVGIGVYYSFPGLKVHSKILLITRQLENGEKDYAYLATGNFNEKTARIYSDLALFTCNPLFTKELRGLFSYLARQTEDVSFEHLLVAPFNMRKHFNQLIDNEIKNAEDGKEAKITVKLNSLQDPKIIQRLYRASNAGVEIKIIVRGICCLIPGVKNMSENIEAVSIVDRFLEHARIYTFYNNGDPVVYSGSADWMTRNLSRRIEVVFPVLDAGLKEEIFDLLDLQLKDNVKARIIDTLQKNNYRKENSGKKVQAQLATYNYLKNKNT
jgi:polyphosphate kinase